MSQADRMLAQVKSLPTMSLTVVRLSKMIDDERSGAADMERVISPDPALTSNLLRLANSPYFGLTRKVESVRQAVTVMGTKRLFEIVAGAGFQSTIPKVIPGYETTSTRFWLHSVAVAALSESLARELRLHPPDYTFTAGLLHDIGKLVIGAYLAAQPEDERPDLMVTEGTLLDREREVFETDHCELGAALAERWNLPKRLQAVARWHHDTEGYTASEHRTLVDLVHAGNGLAHTLGYGSDIGEMSREVKDAVIARLKITTDRLERVASETFEKIVELGQVFTGESGLPGSS